MGFLPTPCAPHWQVRRHGSWGLDPAARGLANTTGRDTKSSGSRCSTPFAPSSQSERREDGCTQERRTWSSWNILFGRGQSPITASVCAMGSITHCWCVVAASIPSTLCVRWGPSTITGACVSGPSPPSLHPLARALTTFYR